MMPQDRVYEITPKVLPADSEATITVRPVQAHAAFEAGASYRVEYYAMEGGQKSAHEPWELSPRSDGCLVLRHHLEGEQEHRFVLVREAGGGRPFRMVVHVYSLREDLFRRRPYLGDLHMHTHYSDGRESPAYVAARCREIGMDFMAITDHGQYAPSIEAQEAFFGIPLELLILRGEEVHPPGNPVHLVNFGGAFSVNALFQDKEQYAAAVDQYERDLGSLAPGCDGRRYAETLFCLDQIREGGGLAIYCHPYWVSGQAYYVSEAFNAQMMNAQPYDALELIGGYGLDEPESNLLQVARYHEERAGGKQIPIVGVTDSHGTDTGRLFGWYWTLVLAPELSQEALISGIKDRWSVAVETLPGERALMYGPFRLSKYAYFLWREVLPLKNRLCEEEGRLMQAHIAGRDVRDRLSEFYGRVRRLYDRLWATE
jgi:hypothetical protein